jgi:hypothetical protein
MKATNGATHSLNGHGLNGHGLNGHGLNGHGLNGHGLNGHGQNGHRSYGMNSIEAKRDAIKGNGRAIFWKAVVIALVLYGISVHEEYLRYLDDVDKVGNYIDTHETGGPSKIAHDLSMPKSTVISALEYLSLKGSTDELRNDLADAPDWP